MPCVRLHLPALDVGGPELLTRFDNRLDSEDPFAETADDMSFYLHADGGFLKLDGDGRITVTDFIREHTGISARCDLCGRQHAFSDVAPGPIRSASDKGSRAAGGKAPSGGTERSSRRQLMAGSGSNASQVRMATDGTFRFCSMK